MKIRLNGKTYNTETSKAVGEYIYSIPEDMDYVHEILFKKRTGEFFLYGEGGDMSIYSGMESVIPFTDDEAQEWLADIA